MTPTLRQHRAAALLAAYVATQVVGPFAHVLGHRNDHHHGLQAARDVSQLDPSTFLDGSGRPDLDALARALEQSEHAEAHAGGRSHDHADDTTPLDHAQGASEHFAALLAPLTPIAATPASQPIARTLATGVDDRDAHVEDDDFLTSQRAQAPPA